MRSLVILFGLALATTCATATSEALLKFLNDSPHKTLACATCRFLTASPCPGCPALEDIDVCGLLKEVEHASNRSLTLSASHAVREKSFRQECAVGTAELKLGDVLDEITPTPSFGQCVVCNMVLGALHFVSDEIPAMEPKLDGVCGMIKGCTPELISAIIKGLRDSMVAFYTLIGVDLLNCPNYQDFIDGCVKI
uniref:Saposin B-type domain-containing protein n=1 Tax=Panagrellus redivivus TaxID=6233 RepID=A0A7E4VNP6_PANRE